MKVAVVGTGNVGSALLFHLADVPSVEEILVMNLQNDWSMAAIMDVASANPEDAARMKVASFDQIGEADLLAMTSGAQMKEGEKGKDVLDANIQIMDSILDSAPLKDGAIVISLATPVDDITAHVQKRYQLHRNHVIGFGGDLDRNRLSYVLHERSLSDDDAHMIGEHGGRSIPVYLGESDFAAVRHKVQNFLGEITTQGGRPRNLATGLLFARLIDSVANDKDIIHYVCGLHPDFDLYITWPYQIGRSGVGPPRRIILPPKAQQAFDGLMDRKREELSNDS
jgi:malate/lactate dehydrogenase